MKYNDMLPWPQLMEIAFGMLHIAPQDFWNMTPPEWLASFTGWKKKYGVTQMPAPDITRGDLERLMGLFPD